MELWTQIFTRHVVRLENRDLVVDPSGVVKLTTWWCTHPERWLGREPEVFKNGAAGFARGEDGEDAHAAATGVANQDIDGEHALEQVGPGEPTASRGVSLIGSGSVHDRGAEMVMGREHAVVASEMTARWWDQVAQAAGEIDRRERELGATVAQGTLEGEDDPTGWIEREPSVGDRGARAITAQALEAVAIVGVDKTTGVERVAIEECGAMAGGAW